MCNSFPRKSFSALTLINYVYKEKILLERVLGALFGITYTRYDRVCTSALVAIPAGSIASCSFHTLLAETYAALQNPWGIEPVHVGNIDGETLWLARAMFSESKSMTSRS